MSTERKCDIFISYRRDGGDMTAMYIYQALKERKYDVFYDLEVLRAGRFNDSLLEYIASCKDFILVLSPGSLDRCNEEGDWVRKEIAEALRLKKNIIPVMLKGFKFPDKLPDDIDDVRYQNGLTATTEYFQESMNRLCTKYLNTKSKSNVPKIAGISGGAALVVVLALILGKNFLPSGNPEPEKTAAVTTEKMTEKVAEKATEKITEKAVEKETEKATEKVTEKATEAATEAPKTEPVRDTDWPVIRHDNPWILYEKEIMAGEDICNTPVFQNEALLHKDVGSITFLNTLAGAGEDAWDISEAQNGSVLAWTEKNGELSDLYIAGEGGVRLSDNYTNLFESFTNVTAIYLNGNLDTSENTNFDSTFKQCRNLQTLDLRTMDTSNATNMFEFFRGCENLTSVDLSNLNTARVTDMGDMFTDCVKLKSLDLSSFNTSRVINMHSMFQNVHLRKLDLSSFDTSRVTDMGGMFIGDTELEEMTLGSKFVTDRVKDMDQMFGWCQNLLELDVSGFDTSKVENMKYMFEHCGNLLELDVSGFDTSNVTDMTGMFEGCELLEELDLSGWNTAKVQNTTNMFSYCSELTTIGTEEGKLYDQFIKDIKKTEAKKYWSREDLMINLDRENWVSVLWDSRDNTTVVCPYAYDENSGHSYLFVNCPATAAKANGYWGDDKYLVTVNSKDEFEFLEQWAQQDGLNFSETWISGLGDPPAVYNEHDEKFDLKSSWEEFCKDYYGRGDLYFDWYDNQPDGSGHWLQLTYDKYGALHMDDLNDMLRRPFILEFDYELGRGEEIDLSWWSTGGNEHEGYGEEYIFGGDVRGRLDETGGFILSGSVETDLSHYTWYNYNIKDVTVKEGVKTIGFHLFDSCINLTSITLPDTITEIGEMAFWHTSLTNITIPANVKSIGWHAFDGCRNLNSIILSEGLESIDECAFSDTNLTSITIPSSVTFIHEAAFDGIVQNLTICGEVGSYAESYAKERGIRFQAN